MNPLRFCCRLLLAGYAVLMSVCQQSIDVQDPQNDLTEYESVHQYLSAYSIWQENVPDVPFGYPDPEAVLLAVHDTLRRNNYTKYIYDFSGASAGQAKAAPTVFLDSLTANTALLTITTFGESTYDDFLDCAPEANRFANIVVDLRQNRGGYLDVLDSILQAFLPGGTAYIKARYREYNDTVNRFVTREWHPLKTINGPMVAFMNKRFAVLMDEFSASASEILISGLYEGKNAALIGTTTYGKGIGQIQVSRRTRPSIQVTFLTLAGISPRIGEYHRVGIAPDPVPADVVLDGAGLDTSRQAIFYAVRTLDSLIAPSEIRYPDNVSRSASAAAFSPLCAKVVEEETILTLFSR